jgi:hypothetical protein
MANSKSSYEHPLKGSTSVIYKKTPAKTPAKSSAKTPAKSAAKTPTIVKPSIKSTYRPNVVRTVIDRANASTAKTPTKAAVKAVVAKPAAKTVSQVWKEKTGMDWSEAKKLGLSDGSAKSNMALLAKLNSGATSRADLGVKVEPITMATKKNEKMATPELATKRKGGPVKMKKGGMKKKSC